MKNNFWNKNAGYVFLLPWLCGFLFLTCIPLGTSFYYSLTDFNLFQQPNFIGIRNYASMFTRDYHFPNAVRVTFKYVFISVPFQLIISLLLAMILNKGIPFLAGLRAMFYIPSLLGSSVAIAILWRQLFGSEGVLNMILSSVGITAFENHSWLTDPRTAIYTLIILRVWQFGSPMIIFLAGLKQIPSSLLESAEIDGAGSVSKMLHITFPLLSPIILFNFIMQIISSFKAFTEAYIISDGTGGISDSVLFFTLHIYNEGFDKFKMGYASALSWFLLFIVSFFTILIFRISKNKVHYY